MTTISHDTLIDEAMLRLDAMMSFRRRAFCEQQLHREISLAQLNVLIELHESGPMTISALATLLRISPPSASTILDRMEEHGLVQRVRDIEDRRVVHVAVSDHGRTLITEMMGMKRGHLQRVFGALSDEELRDLIRGLDVLRTALSRINDVGDPATAS